jgi:hypothetical protein
MTDIETLVRGLADRAALEDLVARHSVWVDEGRWDETDRIFTEDVAVKSPRGEARGIAELLDLVKQGHDMFAQTVHNKSDLVIDLDGDTARVRAHDIALFVVDDTAVSLAAGVHHYRARRTENGWRFTSLEIVPAALTANLPRATLGKADA